MFALWFASGAVLFFVPFPALDLADARARAAPITIPVVRLSPANALAQAPGATGLRLVERLGTPAYVATLPSGDLAISANTGARLSPLTAEQAGAVAAAFGRAAVWRVSEPLRYDQWTVHQGFDHARPLYRVSLDDTARTDLYVSAATGEVVQKTRAFERTWNWPGAVVHWLYFTPLRRTFAVWNATVWWVSLVALVMSLIGMGLGIYRTLRARSTKRPAWSPFRGWLQWHHLLGLVGGAVLISWIFSGWLSMDHGRLFSRASSPSAQAKAYAGTALAAALRQLDPARLRALHGVTSITFTPVAGQLVVTGRGPQAPQVLLPGQPPASHIPAALVLTAFRAAYPHEAVIGPYPLSPNDFYGKAEGMPTGTDVYRLRGPRLARVFVDPSTGAVLAVVNRSRTAYDWVYYGLHTFNAPGLIDHPVLRAWIVLPLLAVGFLLSATGVVVAARRLRLSLA